MKKITSLIFYKVKRLDFFLFLLLFWEVFARWIYPHFEPQASIFFPPLSKVLKELWQLALNGILAEHILASTRRVLIGFSLASFSAIILGFFLGVSPKAYQQLKVFCQIFKPIPPVAWIPLSLLWFGITEAQQYFIIFIGVFFLVLAHTLDGVDSVSLVHKQAAKTLGSNGLMFVRQILFPAAFPKIMFGLHSGLAYSWFIIVAAEFVSASSGLGYLILEGRNVIITERIFAGMITIGLVNFIFYFLLIKLTKIVMPWQVINTGEDRLYGKNNI